MGLVCGKGDVMGVEVWGLVWCWGDVMKIKAWGFGLQSQTVLVCAIVRFKGGVAVAAANFDTRAVRCPVTDARRERAA